MSFSARSVRGGHGEVDHRLARRRLLREFRTGRIGRNELCDAHPELVRAARNVGDRTSIRCPVCERDDVVLVTYVFGPRLPAFGRCVTTRAELQAITERVGEFTGYVVEVCPTCHWNHLARTFILPSTTPPAEKPTGRKRAANKAGAKPRGRSR